MKPQTEIEKKLRELNFERIKNMQLGEVVDIMILPESFDETFLEQVKEKYFEISKN